MKNVLLPLLFCLLFQQLRAQQPKQIPSILGGVNEILNRIVELQIPSYKPIDEIDRKITQLIGNFFEEKTDIKKKEFYYQEIMKIAPEQYFENPSVYFRDIFGFTSRL